MNQCQGKTAKKDKKVINTGKQQFQMGAKGLQNMTLF